VRSGGLIALFLGPGERRRGVAGGSNDGVNGFNTIEDGGEVKRGIMAGRVTAQAASEGGARWRGVAKGDGADRRAPHGNDVRERRCLYQSAQSRREYAFRQLRQRGLGRVGRAGSRQPAGHSGPAQAGLRRMGRKRRKNSFPNKKFNF
jgi:hypothetical protein